ncbi:adenine phosphoribosyltransferase [candidate division WOR-3 bacterium]|nr:adenine phosphoribosyltransferase [candidate division WOR-3 bacterium]
MEELKEKIRNIPDFPEQGILFRDITTLLMDDKAFKQAVDLMTDLIRNEDIDVILGIEARGFIFAAPIAYQLGLSLNMIRKPGKLPAETIQESYTLEYGENSIEVHKDAISKGDRVVICDDLLATGGTAQASAHLVEQLGGEVSSIIFLVELTELKGREKIKGYPVHSIVKY